MRVQNINLIAFAVLFIGSSALAESNPRRGRIAVMQDEAASKNAVAGAVVLTESVGFAAPSATVSQLQEDEIPKMPVLRFPWFDKTLQPWFDWKKTVQEKSGLQFGLAYTTLFQGAVDYDNAASGILRFSGNWALIDPGGKNAGNLVFSADHRHSYTDTPPGKFNGLNSGYYGITGPLFTDVGLIMGDLNWQQRLFKGKTGLVIGRYDPNDFFGVLGYANPWTAFQNLAILFNPTIILPDWGWGVAAGHWIDDSYYVKASLSDANAYLENMDFFAGGAEFYSTAEIGWSPSSAERYLKNFHVMAWHMDERTENPENAGPSGHGVTFGANWTWDQTFMLFTKLGWSEGESQLYNESVTVGALYRIKQRSDLLGYGFNWGSPASPGLRDQYTNELFYRLQFAENLTITPSLQLLIDPALNPDENRVWVGSVRIRVTL